MARRFSTTSIGGSLYFPDDTARYVHWPSNNIFYNNDGFSVSVWFYIDPNAFTDNNNAILSCTSTTEGTTLFEIAQWQSGGTKLVFFSRDKNNVTIIGSEFNDTPLTPGWTHLVYAQGATTGNIYINGVADGDFTFTQPAVGDVPFDRSGVGALATGAAGVSFPFKGHITGLRVWDTTLTAAEAADVYYDDEKNDAVRVYNFDDGYGSTLTDSVGSDDGTLVGNLDQLWQSSQP